MATTALRISVKMLSFLNMGGFSSRRTSTRNLVIQASPVVPYNGRNRISKHFWKRRSSGIRNQESEAPHGQVRASIGKRLQSQRSYDFARAKKSQYQPATTPLCRYVSALTPIRQHADTFPPLRRYANTPIRFRPCADTPTRRYVSAPTPIRQHADTFPPLRPSANTPLPSQLPSPPSSCRNNHPNNDQAGHQKANPCADAESVKHREQKN